VHNTRSIILTVLKNNNTSCPLARNVGSARPRAGQRDGSHRHQADDIYMGSLMTTVGENYRPIFSL